MSIAEQQRSGVRVVISGKLYQRGQILTWTLDAKRRFFGEMKLRALVNLWPKVDPDLASLDLEWYCQLFCGRSEDTLRPSVLRMAETTADYLSSSPASNALVLCEAGKTRSVFFCIMVVKFYNGVSFPEARDIVLGRIPSTALKRFMTDWIDRQ
jgi:hypothetical protein